MGKIHKMASAIFNDVVGGLGGYSATLNMSIELLEDEVVETRLNLIKKYSMQNALPAKDLMQSINCIEIDCGSLDKCCEIGDYDEVVSHFEIPLIVNDFGKEAIEYIGSTNKQVKFKVYTSLNFKNHKYKTRGSKKPYVYIDTTPNKNNMYDCYLFLAPLLERVSVRAIFKDERLLEGFGCCTNEELDNMTWLDNEVKTTLTAKKLQYYRLYTQLPQPNTQAPR